MALFSRQNIQWLRQNQAEKNGLTGDEFNITMLLTIRQECGASPEELRLSQMRLENAVAKKKENETAT